VYENGVLRPLRPLDLPDHERVALTIIPIDHKSGPYEPDHEFLESLRNELRDAGPAPGLEDVRHRLSKIPGSLTEDFRAEREDR